VDSGVETLNAICREDFTAFAAKAFEVVEPGTEFEWNWHVECVAEHLMACYRGEIKRLIINVPPRTLKSYLVARAFPAWVMGKNPHEKFICTSYGEPVAEQNSLAARAIVNSEWYRGVFPDTAIGELDRNTHWTTSKGGQYYAASALSPITGIGCRFMVIDDPLKPMEASSDQIRKSVNENIRATLFNRFDDKRKGCIILIMQRVHEDDTTGNLVRDGGWVHLKLPAEATHPIEISLGNKTWKMERGDLLLPSRLSREILKQTELDMTAYHYAGQYQQEPVALGGGEFKHEWIQYYSEGGLKPAQMNVVILVDPAGGEELNKKKKKLSDWTAMMVVGCAPDNNYYLLDIVRDRMNPTDRINMLFVLHRKWNTLCGKPPKVGYEKYGMMTDTHYIADKKRQDAYNFPLIELGGSMGKEERIRRLIPDMQNGRWYFPPSLVYVDCEGRRFDLVQELVNSEMPTFPRARHDDMLDALSRIYESDLSMSFPKPHQGMVAKALKSSYNKSGSSYESWEDF